MESEKTRPEIGDERSFRFRDALDRIGAAIAIVPILSALLYYIGRTTLSSAYSYFGIHSSMLNLTTTEYVLQGTTVTLVPLGVLLILLLILVRLHPRVEGWAATFPIPVIATITGTLLLAFSIVRLFDSYYTGNLIATTAASGILLVAYAGYLRRRIAIRKGEPDPWKGSSAWPTRAFAVLAILVAIYFVFFLTGKYAEYVGRQKAQETALGLPSSPEVVLYTSKRLMLRGPGIVKTRVSQTDAAEQYRFSGLRLLV
jgi:hypothetical protein